MSTDAFNSLIESRRKVSQILYANHHEIYDFSEFMQLLRIIYRMTRLELSKQTRIPNLRLFHLEMGCFKKMPNPEKKELERLEHFYNLPHFFLLAKAKKYLIDGHGFNQRFGKKKRNHPLLKDS